MIERKYLVLNSHIIFVEGTNNAAICDLSNGDMISLNPSLGSILKLCEEGKSVDDIANHEHRSIEQIYSELKQITDNNMGTFFPERVYIERYKLGSPYDIDSMSPPVVRKLYIELPCDCGLTCPSCGFPALYPCALCKNNAGTQNESDIKNALSRIIQMDCKEIVFHGGDPLLDMEYTSSLLNYCRDQNYNETITIISNGTTLNKKKVNILNKLNVNIKIPLFVGNDNHYKNTINTKIKLLEKNKTFFSIVIVTNDSEYDSTAINDLISSLPTCETEPSVIINEASPTHHYQYPGYINATRRVIASNYYHAKHHHPCMHGTLAISLNGNILPCPDMTKEVLGNISSINAIDEIFENKSIYEFWDLTLSSVDNCRDCAFRYGCMDCRALEMNLTGDIYGKTLCSLPGKSGIYTNNNPEQGN